MATGTADLRKEVEAAALANIERAGPGGIDKAGLVRRFSGRGAGRSTLFRWIQELERTGRAGQHLAHRVKEAAAERAAAPAPPIAIRQAVQPNLPVLPTLDDIAGAGGTIAVIDQLRECTEAARAVMKHARNQDGSVRMGKLLLAASEHLRRNLETAVRLHESIYESAKTEEFHRRIIESIEKVARRHPVVAEEMLLELHRLAASFLPAQQVAA